jgi:hypothetical protein
MILLTLPDNNYCKNFIFTLLCILSLSSIGIYGIYIAVNNIPKEDDDTIIKEYFIFTVTQSIFYLLSSIFIGYGYIILTEKNYYIIGLPFLINIFWIIKYFNGNTSNYSIYIFINILMFFSVLSFIFCYLFFVLIK